MKALNGQARLRALCPVMPHREQLMSSRILTSTDIPAALHLQSGRGVQWGRLCTALQRS